MAIPFRPIARLLASTVHPAPKVDMSAVRTLFLDLEKEPRQQGILLTANHYSGPDFHSWWFVILISSLVPQTVHWITSAGWTNSGWLTPVTHFIFPIGARLLGFTPMPPMPPDPADTERRAIAVRQVLRYAGRTPHPVIGLTPEGGDMPGGVLGSLPPGVGKFIYLLTRDCPKIIPIGVWKEDGRINLKFGNPYKLEIPDHMSNTELDERLGTQVMRHIADLIPVKLRGKYQ